MNHPVTAAQLKAFQRQEPRTRRGTEVSTCREKAARIKLFSLEMAQEK